MAVRGGALALAAMLAATAAVAVVSSRRAPEPGSETTHWLAIESLAVDGDRILTEADRARFAERFGARPVGVLGVADGEQIRFDTPWLWTWLAAAARAAAGPAGPPLLQWSLFAWTAVMAALTLSSRLGGGSASLLALVALAGTAASLVPLRLEPRALEMAAIASAAAVVWYRWLGPARPAEQVYRGSLDVQPASIRWLVAGVLTAPVLLAGPTYLPLALPLLAAAPPGRRGLATTLFGLGALPVAGGLVLFGGPPWEPLAGSLSAALYGWAGLGLLLGRGVGLLPYFVAGLLLMTLVGRGEGRRWVLPALAASIALQTVLAPFDFVEGALLPGNAWFLPLLALLLLAADSTESPRATLAIGALGVPLLLAPWLAAVGAGELALAVGERTSIVERLLPSASTLRRQPGAPDLERGAVRVRGFTPGVVAAREGGLSLRGARGDLLVTSDRPLSSLRLELGRSAPAQIDLRGGTAGNVTYRPSGEMAIDVLLEPKRARRHPVWWSPRGAWSHSLELRLPQRPVKPIDLDVPFARPAVPAEDGR